MLSGPVVVGVEVFVLSGDIGILCGCFNTIGCRVVCFLITDYQIVGMVVVLLLDPGTRSWCVDCVPV